MVCSKLSIFYETRILNRRPAELHNYYHPVSVRPFVCLPVCLSVTLCISLNSKAICIKLSQRVAHTNTSKLFFHFFDATSKIVAMPFWFFCGKFVRTTPPELKVVEPRLQSTLYMCPFENWESTAFKMAVVRWNVNIFQPPQT